MFSRAFVGLTFVVAITNAVSPEDRAKGNLPRIERISVDSDGTAVVKHDAVPPKGEKGLVRRVIKSTSNTPDAEGELTQLERRSAVLIDANGTAVVKSDALPPKGEKGLVRRVIKSEVGEVNLNQDLLQDEDEDVQAETKDVQAETKANPCALCLGVGSLSCIYSSKHQSCMTSDEEFFCRNAQGQYQVQECKVEANMCKEADEADGGQKDKSGRGCIEYVGRSWLCGLHDHAAFRSNEMCCTCGGGSGQAGDARRMQAGKQWAGNACYHCTAHGRYGCEALGKYGECATENYWCVNARGREKVKSCEAPCVDRVCPRFSCSYLVNTWEGGTSCNIGDTNYNFKHATSFGPLSTSELCCASCAKSQPQLQCAFDYGSQVGDAACCGQPGLKGNSNSYVCPSNAPSCVDYTFNVKFGKCQTASQIAQALLIDTEHDERRVATMSSDGEASVKMGEGNLNQDLNGKAGKPGLHRITEAKEALLIDTEHDERRVATMYSDGEASVKMGE